MARLKRRARRRSIRVMPLISTVVMGCSETREGSTSLPTSAACEDVEGSAGHAAMDSAGIHVVVNVSPAWAASDALRLGTAPALTIGVTHGDQAYEFGRISFVTRMTDGRIVVGDGQAAELQVFDTTGRFQQTVGGRGAGPGEFRVLSAVARTAGDTLWVNDPGNRRVTKLDPNFVVVETIPLTPIPRAVTTAPGARPASSSSPLRLKGVFSDGTLLASSALRTLRTEEVTNVSRDSLILRRVHPGRAATDSLGLLLGIQRFEFFTPDGSVTFGEAPLGYAESLAVGSDRYYYGSAERFEIEERTPDGRLVRLIRVCEEPEAIDGRRLDAFIEQQLAGFTSEALVYEEPAWRGIPRPAVAPSFLDLHVDGADRLWVRDFTYPDDPQRWPVFDPEGRWLGEVETPADLTILEIGSDYVLGRHTNELDVQSVRMYSLRSAR